MSVTPSVPQVSHRDTRGTDGPPPCSSAEEHPTSNRMAGGSNPPKGTAWHRLSKGLGKPLASCHRRVSASCMNPSLICREGSGNTLESSRIPRGIHPDSMRNNGTNPHEHRAGRT